jgi:hypothetical protein
VIVTLNRDEVLSLVKKQLWRFGVNISDIEGEENVSLNAEIGFINGDLAVVIGVNEEIPEDLLDNEELHDASVDEDTTEQVAQNAGKPAKGGKRRKRRTRAEIEADEAKAKQAAEAEQQPETAKQTEAEAPNEVGAEAEETQADQNLAAEPEETADKAEAVEAQAEVAEAAADEPNLFVDAEPATAGGVDPEPEPTANPFPVDEDENLFADSPAETKPVVETEEGFAKPKEDDDDAINLFA